MPCSIYMFCITALYFLKVCRFQFTLWHTHHYTLMFLHAFGTWGWTPPTRRVQSEHRLLLARVLFVARSEFQRGLLVYYRYSIPLVRGNALSGKDVPPFVGEYIPRIYHSHTFRIPFIFLLLLIGSNAQRLLTVYGWSMRIGSTTLCSSTCQPSITRTARTTSKSNPCSTAPSSSWSCPGAALWKLWACRSPTLILCGLAADVLGPDGPCPWCPSSSSATLLRPSHTSSPSTAAPGFHIILMWKPQHWSPHTALSQRPLPGEATPTVSGKHWATNSDHPARAWQARAAPSGCRLRLARINPFQKPQYVVYTMTDRDWSGTLGDVQVIMAVM